MAEVGPDPLPRVVMSGLEVGVEEWATLPTTSTVGAPARIQQLIDAPDDLPYLYVVDTQGVSWVIDADGSVLPQAFLDFRGQGLGFLDPSTEAGFRSMVFHPDFANPGTDGYGKLYTIHTAVDSSAQAGVPRFEVPSGTRVPEFDSVVTEWTVTDPSNPTSVDFSSRRELFRLEEPYEGHNANTMVFNPNAQPGDADYGMMYIGIGDGGAAGGPFDLVTRLDQLRGKILRIDPLLQDDGSSYGIPDDNPFNDNPAALHEIYALGFRNPQSLVFDTEGLQSLFVGDIGQNRIEEINVILPGGNYGWNEREGTFVYVENLVLETLPADDASLGFQYPLVQYDHEEIAHDPFLANNAAISAGLVYRGTAIPELNGQFLFVDFPTGRLFHVPIDDQFASILADGVIGAGEQLVQYELTQVLDGTTVLPRDYAANAAGRADLRFGQDATGQVYVFSKQVGKIWKLTISGEAITGTSADEMLEGTAHGDIIRGEGGNDEIHGLAGQDSIAGNEANDTLYGDAGNDTLDGGSGNDSLLGGSGNDTLAGGNNNDTLDGGAGNDAVGGGLGNDVFVFAAGTGDDTVVSFVDGEDKIDISSRGIPWTDVRLASVPDGVLLTIGDDSLLLTGTTLAAIGEDDFLNGDSGNLHDIGESLTGGNGNDTIDGQGGNDTIVSGGGADVLFGSGGDDSLSAGGDNDSLSGGTGNDTLRGVDGDDTLLGNDGDDSLIGGPGADLADGGTGNDTLRGGDGNDQLTDDLGNDSLDGQAGNDTLVSGGGNDTLSGGDGDDSVSAGFGDDRLLGDAGNDTVRGVDGADTLLGDSGNDSLIGGPGSDRVEGGSGDDTLRGDEGTDLLIGGTGRDRFVFFSDATAGTGADTIADFSIVDGDRIQLKLGLPNYDAVRALLVDQGADTLIDLSTVGGRDVLVIGVTLAELDQPGNFLL